MTYPVLIIDNCISEDDQNLIESIFGSNSFPWYYSDSANWGNQKEFTEGLLSLGQLPNVVDTPQFIHYVYNSEQIWSEHVPLDLCIKIISAIPYTIKKLLRIKSNLTYRYEDFKKNSTGTPHIDFIENSLITAIYYVNDSDGDTIIYNEIYEDRIFTELTISQIIKPKKGRLIVFDGRRIHSGASPIVNDKRVVINFDFIPH